MKWAQIIDRERIARAALRIFLMMFFMEILLRFGGFVFLSLQAYQNNVRAKESGEYRIVCLGASDTANGGENSYPKQLERVLNREHLGLHFKVINKGIPSA